MMMSSLLRVMALAVIVGSCGDAEGSGPRGVDRGRETAWVWRRAPRDSTMLEAQKALAQGRPWHATELLAPVLADSTRRTPAAVLLAAVAASEWRGWRQVRDLLASEPWVDSLEYGLGRELLARAALGLAEDSAAVRDAASAAAVARTDRDRGVRLVLLARALDRIDALDSAKTTYERAAGLLPSAGDWLHLRAAGVASDSVERARLYSAVETAVARNRVANTEALARERTRDIPGAIRGYAALGARLSALRLRAATDTDSVSRVSVRKDLIAVLGGRSSSDARIAAEILDASFAPLTAAEELALARGVRFASASRAQAAYSRALAAGLGTSRDRFDYAELLFRLDRHGEAAASFSRIRKPDPLAGIAAYQRARSLLYAGDAAAARTGLRMVLRNHPTDTAAALALYLLADLATDDLRDPAARDAFRELVRRFPRHPRAPTAAFRAALISYTEGRPRAAALELDSIIARYGSSGEALAARYWSGRAWAAVGDSARAAQRWRDAVGREPLSYYSAAAARRLGQTPWAPPAAPDTFASFAAVDSGFARIDLLERLGMDVEAGLEADRLAADASASVERLMATSAGFRDRGDTPRSISLAQQALSRGAPRDARVYRLIYPVVLRDVLIEESRATDLDPTLVAALIRQESRFVPRATSAAGARGLMQVMPDVGRTIARSLSFPIWDAVLLYQADVNAKLGTRHLADLVRRYDNEPHILAAYNAGVSRVERWRTKKGVDDPEMFTERIPYVETRDYVRIVLRNRDLYRALYEWEPATVVPDGPAQRGPR
jgi:soluble lytic murein transglycosylase